MKDQKGGIRDYKPWDQDQQTFEGSEGWDHKPWDQDQQTFEGSGIRLCHFRGSGIKIITPLASRVKMGSMMSLCMGTCYC